MMKKIIIILTAFVSLLSDSAHAVNFATGVRPSAGYQLKLFTFYYSADTRTNKDGDTAVTDLGLEKYGVLLGNCYQIGDLQLSALIPVGKLKVGKVKRDDAGLGDIQLRAGWYLPVEWASVLPMLMIKAPTGSYDKNHPVNYGDGQTDLVTELYLFKLMQPISFDAVLKYNFRFRNPDTDVTPGNEFTAEALVTYRLAEKIRVGPAVNFLVGADNRKGANRVFDSGLMRFAAGGEVWYGRFDYAKISLAVYKDLITRNTNEGVMVLSRIGFEF